MPPAPRPPRRLPEGKPPADGLPRLTHHPRARRQIAAAKSWAALVVFALVVVTSLASQRPWTDGLLRAIAAGTLAYFVAWGLAILVWRSVAQAEIRGAQERHREAVRAAQEALEERRARQREEAERARAEAGAAQADPAGPPRPPLTMDPTLG